MAEYEITHETHYTYEEPVSVCHNMAYLLPRHAPHHQWSRVQVDIAPRPTISHERRDYFGNCGLYFAIQEPHLSLTVTATGHVKIAAPSPHAPSSLSWEMTREWLQDRGRREQFDVFQYLFPSPYVTLPPGIEEYAALSFDHGRPMREAVLDLCARIHDDIAYDPSATTVSTTVQEVLRHQRGVCQDFAHFMIAGLRAMGLAARYVSGYLLTNPPPGKPRLVGADASHAWVSVFLPDAHNAGDGTGGWLDIDPTNDILPTDKHVTLAWGRDFGDVSPLRGVILGGGQHVVSVSVDVRPSTPPEDADDPDRELS